MNIQIKTIKTYLLLYKLTRQVNYLRQAKKLASELKSKQASDLTVFILKPLNEV